MEDDYEKRKDGEDWVRNGPPELPAWVKFINQILEENEKKKHGKVRKAREGTAGKAQPTSALA